MKDLNPQPPLGWAKGGCTLSPRLCEQKATFPCFPRPFERSSIAAMPLPYPKAPLVGLVTLNAGCRRVPGWGGPAGPYLQSTIRESSVEREWPKPLSNIVASERY